MADIKSGDREKWSSDMLVCRNQEVLEAEEFVVKFHLEEK